MDEELRAMLEDARSRGASDTDLDKLVDLYEAENSKKKSINGTTPNQKLDSGSKIGSADSVNGMKVFKGLTPEEQNTIKTGNKPEPKVNKIIKNKIQETQLTKELSNTKVTPQNQDQISAKTDQLSALQKETNSQIDLNKLNNVKRIEKDFYPAVGTPDTYKPEAEQRYNDAVQQNGIWNNIKALGKQGYNSVVGQMASLTDEEGVNDLKVSTDPLDDKKKEVKAEALKNKEKLTDTEINDRAKELFIREQADNIYTDKANSFLDDLSDEDKDALEISRREKIPHLSKENDQRTRFNDAISTLGKTKLAEIQQLEGEIKKMQENNQPIPDEIKKQYLSLGQQLKGIGERYSKNREYLQRNTKDLGTAEQELDLFKRENSDFKNALGNIGAAGGEFMNGLLGEAAALTMGAGDPAIDAFGKKAHELSSQFGKDLERQREGLRKPVDQVEGKEGFINYASDILFNQVPLLAATATGAGGLTALGASSAGQQHTKMVDDVKSGKASYSPLQMFLVSQAYGAAEALPEINMLNILKKGGRVLEAIGRESPDLIKKTLGQKTKEFAKEYGLDQLKEHGGEQFTNAMQNVLTGKPIFENAGTVFKDTATLTSLLQASPHIAGLAVKPFIKGTDLGKMDENSRKIIEFSKQLKNDPYLSDTEKTVIQKNIDKATKESSEIMANTIDKIGEMPTNSYEEVVKLNEEAGKIKAQAKEINDGNLPNKEELLKGLAEDYKALHEKRADIIEGKTTPIELLPLKEQETLKKQAMEDLVTELNPDGTKDMTITNEQVVKRANEIYAESEKNKKQEEITPNQTEKTQKSEENLPLNEVQAKEKEEKPEVNLPLNEEVETEKTPTETESTETPKTVKEKLVDSAREVFGLKSKKAEAGAAVMEKMVESMAKRAGISKEEMLDKIGFEKADKTTAEKLAKKGKALFQIIGEKAKLNPEEKQSLADAKAMEKEGKDTKEIYEKTGWEKGKDKKWKYDMHEGNVEFKKFTTGLLGNILDYKELFEKYPKAKDIRVIVNDRLNGYGMFNHETNTIYLNPEYGQETAKSTLLHEIQHWVQRQERFAVGGSPAKARKTLEDKIKAETNFSVKKALTKFKNLISSENIDQNKLDSELSKFKNLVSKSDFDLYESIAGEVEARNVEKRINMSEEQRRSTPLSETETNYKDEKISRDEQIVLFQGEKGAMLAKDAKFMIYAFKNADVSTFLHEAAHVFEHYLTDAEKQTILDFAEHSDWTRETSEKFARSFEKYLADGEAPSPEMKTIFENFKKWMTDIYNGITNSEIDIKVSPEMKQLFDTMLGKEETEAKIEEKTTEKPPENPKPKITTKTVTSLKNAKYDVDIDQDGNVTEIRSQKDGRVVSPFAEIINKQTGKTRLQKNSNWTKIAADAIGEKTEHQVIKEKKEDFKKILEDFKPTNEHEAALQALLTGSKVSLESLQKETGNTDSSWATNKSSDKTLPSIEKLSEQISENNPDLDQTEIRNELIDIISKTGSIKELQEKFQDIYTENQESLKNQELEAFKNSLSAKDLAMYDSVQAEDDYISDLTDEEAIQYFKEQYNVKTYESEQSEQSRETENRESRQTQTDSVQASNDGKESSATEQEKEIDKSFFDRVLDQKEVKPVLDFLDTLKLNTTDLKSTIPFAPQAWNAFIDAVKLSVKAGNTVSKAIQEASKALKANGVSVDDINAMKDYFTQKVNTKENTEVAVLKQKTKGEKTLAKTKEKFKNEISDLKKQIADVSDSINKVRTIEQREALKTQRKELQENLTKKIEEFKEETLAKTKEKYRGKISDLKTQIADITNSINKVRTIEQKEALKAQRKELQEKLTKQKEEFQKKLTKQKEEFKEKIAEIRRKNSERKRKNPKKTKAETTPETDENRSDEEIYDEVNNTFDSSIEQLKNKKLPLEQAKEAYRKYVKGFTDRQFLPKMLLNKTGLDKTKNLIINSHGASGHAKVVFEEAYNEIYKGLNRKERLSLDKIIQSNRIIAIDTNREEKGLEPVKHPNNINKSKAEIFLKELEKTLGKEKYDDLVKRSDAYFKTYKDLLTKMQQNGLISKKSLESMDIKYQPRVFLKHITDFNGDFRPEKSSSDINTGKLSGEQIKKMKEGSADKLVLNSEWLLTNSLSARYKAMAMNNINKKFMTEEFPKAQKRFTELEKDLQEGKELSKEDARFHEYFKELNSKIIDNPIVGTTATGNPKFKYDKVPNKNFQKAYYYEDGQRKEFFMEKELHNQWHDNIAGIMSQPLKEVLSYATGAALVKTMATGINPTFPIVNTPRDLLFTLAFSNQYSTNMLKALPQILGDAGNALKELQKDDSDILQKYIQYGGKMDMLNSQGRLQKTSMVGKVVDKTIDPKTRDSLKKAFDIATLHKASEYSEMMFRIGLFQRSIANQLKELNLKDISEVTDEGQKDDIYNQAVTNAREVLDFNQGGAITKDLESVLPYINVAFQGGRVAAAAFNKNPIETTVKVLQIAAAASAFPVGISLMLLSAFKDDEDKDKTATEIYLHAIEGMSKDKKSRSMSIVLPYKNKDGEHAILNFAKAQELSPVMSLTDNIVNNLLRRQVGQKQKDAKSVLDDALFTFGSNVLPIDPTQGPSGTLTRNPFVKAVMSSATGHDFFRDQPLSTDIDKVPREVEGINMKRTEEFYKTIGEKTGWSPVRTKAAVESYITSPDTNPFVGTLYAGLNASVSDKGMGVIGKDLLESIHKSTVKRLISYGSDFNRQLSANEELQEKIDKINADKYRKKSDLGTIANQVANKEITQKEADEKLAKLSPEDRKKARAKISDRVKFKRVDKPLIDIKYEEGNDVKALMLAHYYGDLFDGSPDSKKIIKQMHMLKGIWTPATRKEFRKLMEENKKKPTEK